MFERYPHLRGALDIATGCYPRFLFGGPVGAALPVFHFHDVAAEQLEPLLRFLRENGYRAVAADAIARLVQDGVHPGAGSVALCFDDAWASLWTVAAPLLRQYDLRAIAYVAPARIQDALAVRSVSSHVQRSRGDEGSPFATWPELRALHESGRIDVHPHTLSHSKIFVADRPLDFVTPRYQPTLLSRPLLNSASGRSYLDPRDWGAPLYPVRSRLADARRFLENAAGRQACIEHVRRHDGASFFERPDWRQDLRKVLAAYPGRYETESEQNAAWEAELTEGREILAARLGIAPSAHMCFPWTVVGRRAAALARRIGYRTAFADRLFGFRAVRAGDPPLRLMRLRHTYIVCLPGKQRRGFLQVLRQK
jgi:peptidoglycan/xylan/chitin deacetylase (PgdA/CDA1 family)